MKKYDVVHLVIRDDAIAAEVPQLARASNIFAGGEFGLAYAMMQGILWALPRAKTIYCHRKDGSVEYKIAVEHIGGKRVI